MGPIISLTLVICLALPLFARDLSTIGTYDDRALKTFHCRSRQNKLDSIRDFLLQLVRSPDLEEVNWFHMSGKRCDRYLLMNLDAQMDKKYVRDNLLPRFRVIYDGAVLYRNQHGPLPGWLIPIVKCVRNIVATLEVCDCSTPGRLTSADERNLRKFINELTDLINLIRQLSPEVPETYSAFERGFDTETSFDDELDVDSLDDL